MELRNWTEFSWILQTTACWIRNRNTVSCVLSKHSTDRTPYFCGPLMLAFVKTAPLSSSSAPQLHPTFIQLPPQLSFSSDIKFRTSVLEHITSKRPTTLMAPGYGPLPTCWAIFFILPTPLWLSILLLSTRLLPASSISKWTPHSSRTTRIHFSSPVGAENTLLRRTSSHFLPVCSYLLLLNCGDS